MNAEELAKLKQEEEAFRHRIEDESGSPRHREHHHGHDHEGTSGHPHGGEPTPQQLFPEGSRYRAYTTSSQSGDTGMETQKMHTQREYNEKLARGEIKGKDLPYKAFHIKPEQAVEKQHLDQASEPRRKQTEHEGILLAERHRAMYPPDTFGYGPVGSPEAEARRKQALEAHAAGHIRLGNPKEEEGGKKEGGASPRKEKRWIARPAAYGQHYY